jgi:dinuclear metal center YbgI/SA1388 family protein
MPTAAEIAFYADSLLRTSEIPDYPNALNGLQIGSNTQISKVAAAVDFSTRAIRGAISVGADLLIVHHGAFWEGLVPITGRRLSQLSELVSAPLAVYSSHLPLDCHTEIGNNALLSKELGLVPESPFAKFNGLAIGCAGHSSDSVEELVQRASRFSAAHGGSVHASSYSKNQRIGEWGICSGGGANAETLQEAIERGINTLIVGEGPHWTAVFAEDNGLTIIYAGHYATETLGVQALAANVAKEFSLGWEFIAAPTGT